MARPKKVQEYKSNKRYYVRETEEMRKLMVLGHERFPDVNSEGEIIRRLMKAGGKYYELIDAMTVERSAKMKKK